MAITLSITASSRVGCIRSNNEDMVLVGQTTVRDGQTCLRTTIDNCGRYTVAVADGMGGHSSGEVASETTIEDFKSFFYELPEGLSDNQFRETVYRWYDAISFKLNNMVGQNEGEPGMGTTLVALAWYDGRCYWMNCGDSRLYLFREEKLTQLTKDHSLNTLYGSNVHSNVLTNCVGGGVDSGFIDIVEIPGGLQQGDTVMLCTDGLTDMIIDDEIASMLSSGCDADALCQAADDAGGNDNNSVALIRIED